MNQPLTDRPVAELDRRSAMLSGNTSAAAWAELLESPEWTMDMTCEGGMLTVQVMRSAVPVCRISSTVGASDDAAATMALADKAHLWIHEYVTRLSEVALVRDAGRMGHDYFETPAAEEAVH